MAHESYLEKYIQCPFYNGMRFDRCAISCEGVEGASCIQTKFKGIKGLKEYVFTRCAKDYVLCPVYRGLYEYYEEEFGNEQKS